MDSPINIELQTIAKGIDNWAPITIGDRIVATFTDRYKNKFTPAPIHKEKPSNGSKYFLFENSILQNGINKIKTIAILIAPNNIGGIEALRPSFAVG